MHTTRMNTVKTVALLAAAIVAIVAIMVLLARANTVVSCSTHGSDCQLLYRGTITKVSVRNGMRVVPTHLRHEEGFRKRARSV